MEVPEDATVLDLKRTINTSLGVPLEDMVLSMDASLVCCFQNNAVGSVYMFVKIRLKVSSG